MKYFLIIMFSFLFLSFTSFSKNLTIEGKIKDHKTNEPIPFANVAIAGTYYGTVSNDNGEFRLAIPDKLSGKSLSINSIGYESYSIQINNILDYINVSLKLVDYPIDEVIIMPDSSLKTLLRKAYKKIPENYPNYPTRSIGFFREYLKQKEGGFLYISEAILDVYKTAYENSSTGQVKLVKSRKNIIQGSDTINDVHFYGGLHFPHKADIVKNRDDIIKPSKDYKYSLKKDGVYNGREVYCIAFCPKNSSKSGIIGEFYLDKESLAYIKFEYHYNDKKLEEREKGNPLTKMSSIEKKKYIFYENFNGKYYLKYGFTKETMLNKRTDNLLEISGEYILTELKVDSVEQIPYNEQIAYSSIISDEAKDYQVSDWKDYTILENDSINKTLLNIKQAQSILTRVNPPTKREKKEKLIKLISRFETDLTLVTYPVSISNGNYGLQLNFSGVDKLRYQSNSADESLSFQYEVAIKYKLSRKLKFFFNASENILSSEKSYYNNGGIEYSIPLKTYGKRIFYSVNAGYGFLKFMKSMGTIDNETEFNFGGNFFDSKQIEAFRGIDLDGIRLGSDLSFQISSFWYLKLFGGWQFNFNQTEKIMLKEKEGFFLGLKSAEENLSYEGIDFFKNGESISSTQFHFQNYFVGLGLKWAF